VTGFREQGLQTFRSRSLPAKTFSPLILLAPVQNQFRVSGSAFPRLSVPMLDAGIDPPVAPA